MKIERRHPECSLEKCIENFHSFDPILWIQEISDIAIKGSKEAESFLAKIVTESDNPEHRLTAFVFLQEINNPSENTLRAFVEFQKDVLGMSLAIEQSLMNRID